MRQTITSLLFLGATLFAACTGANPDYDPNVPIPGAGSDMVASTSDMGQTTGSTDMAAVTVYTPDTSTCAGTISVFQGIDSRDGSTKTMYCVPQTLSCSVFTGANSKTDLVGLAFGGPRRPMNNRRP
jgi:hypothetical protein